MAVPTTSSVGLRLVHRLRKRFLDAARQSERERKSIEAGADLAILPDQADRARRRGMRLERIPCQPAARQTLKW